MADRLRMMSLRPGMPFPQEFRREYEAVYGEKFPWPGVNNRPTERPTETAPKNHTSPAGREQSDLEAHIKQWQEMKYTTEDDLKKVPSWQKAMMEEKKTVNNGGVKYGASAKNPGGKGRPNATSPFTNPSTTTPTTANNAAAAATATNRLRNLANSFPVTKTRNGLPAKQQQPRRQN